MPLAARAALVLAGELRLVPALAAGLAVVAGATAAALLWTRDLALIMAALRRANGEAGTQPWLPATARVEREARLLSRALAARAVEVEHLLRAEAGIVERLPDPLLVLGADRGVRRANAAA